LSRKVVYLHFDQCQIGYFIEVLYETKTIWEALDDFEKEYPGFDWKNTPAYKHPGGRDCPCPKHEYIREQVNVAKAVSETSKQSSAITLKFCPDHYQVYLKEVIPAMPLKFRILTKIALKMGAIKIEQLKYMQSDQCFYCKFGSGGHDKKSELPPVS
jgi:hypothetical protein